MNIPISARRAIFEKCVQALRLSRRIINLALGTLLAIVTTQAFSQDRQADAKNQYQIDRTNCLSGHTNEDQKTCLQEAAAAQEERRRGRLEGSNTQYAKNSTLRCQALDAANREDCERRMQGQGTVSGSVESGGIYRELVTPIQIQPAPDNTTGTPSKDASQH